MWLIECLYNVYKELAAYEKLMFYFVFWLLFFFLHAVYMIVCCRNENKPSQNKFLTKGYSGVQLHKTSRSVIDGELSEFIIPPFLSACNN